MAVLADEIVDGAFKTYCSCFNVAGSKLDTVMQFWDFAQVPSSESGGYPSETVERFKSWAGPNGRAMIKAWDATRDKKWVRKEK